MYKTPKILIKKVGDDYVCHIPSLSIISKNNSLDIAYTEALNRSLVFYRFNETKNLVDSLHKYKKYFFATAFCAITFSFLLQGIFFQVIDHHYLQLKRKIHQELNPKQEKQIKRLEKLDSNIKIVRPYIKTFIRVIDEK